MAKLKVKESDGTIIARAVLKGFFGEGFADMTVGGRSKAAKAAEEMISKLTLVRCKHTNITHEPPTCCDCGRFVCEVCRVALKNPVGLCAECTDKPVKTPHDKLAEEAKEYDSWKEKGMPNGFVDVDPVTKEKP
jgi:hypothetical protein